MIATRQSGAQHRNERVRSVERPGGNRDWIAALDPDVVIPGAVVLVGGGDVVGFRIRVAQGHLRHDLLPSFWSIAGIVSSPTSFLTVPLDDHLDPARVPPTNAIVECAFADYDDPVRYPNVAVINFAAAAREVVNYASALRRQRSAVDLPQLVVAWLAFAWGAGVAGNPLVENLGVPAAAFVETAFGIAGIELTPGVASVASCPEAIWQSAIWWHEYYEKTTSAFPDTPAPGRGSAADSDLPTAVVPSGAYYVRQPAAAVTDERD